MVLFSGAVRFANDLVCALLLPRAMLLLTLSNFALTIRRADAQALKLLSNDHAFVVKESSTPQRQADDHCANK